MVFIAVTVLLSFSHGVRYKISQEIKNLKSYFLDLNGRKRYLDTKESSSALIINEKNIYIIYIYVYVCVSSLYIILSHH